MKIKKILNSNKIISIIIPRDYKNEGVNFLTNESLPLQLALITSSANSEAKKHFHPEYKRVIKQTIECIFIKKGKVMIFFYNDKKDLIDQYLASNGDVIFFITGGHGIQYIEDSEIVEIRQGPYNNKFDKKFF